MKILPIAFLMLSSKNLTSKATNSKTKMKRFFLEKRETDMDKQELPLMDLFSDDDIDSHSEVEKNAIKNLDVIQFLRSFDKDNVFDLIIIDPPYNIGKDFGNNADNMPIAEYVAWSITYLDECLRLIKPSAPIYLYGFPEILSHIAVKHPIENQRWLVWHYTNKTVPTSKFWQRSYENILCLWKGNKPKLNIDDIREQYTDGFLKNAAGKTRNSRYCRYSHGDSKTIYQAHDKGALPRDVIKIPALSGGAGASERIAYCKKCDEIVLGKERHNHNKDHLVLHPTQKPIELTKKLIMGSMPTNILIPFAGSGSECYLAKKMNIDFYATDINSEYVKLANKWLKQI